MMILLDWFGCLDEKGSLRREREFVQQCMDSLKNAATTFNEVCDHYF